MPDILPAPQDDALLYRQTRDAVRTVLHCGDPAPAIPDLADRIIAAMAVLPERERTCIELYLGAGFTLLDIALQRGVSERTVQYAIYEGIRAIAARVF